MAFLLKAKKKSIWEFSVPVVKQKSVVLVPIDHAQEVEYFSLTATDLQIGPGGILLNYQVVSKEYPELTSNIGFRVEDSFGNELKIREGGSVGRQYLKGKYLFDPIDNNTRRNYDNALSLDTKTGRIGRNRLGRKCSRSRC